MELSIWKSLIIDRKLNSTTSFVILAFYRIQHLLYEHENYFFLKLMGGQKLLFF